MQSTSADVHKAARLRKPAPVARGAEQLIEPSGCYDERDKVGNKQQNFHYPRGSEPLRGRFRRLHPDAAAFWALPFALLVIDVAFEFFHRGSARIAGHWESLSPGSRAGLQYRPQPAGRS